MEWQGVTSNRKGIAWTSGEKLREAMAWLGEKGLAKEWRSLAPSCNGIAWRCNAREQLGDDVSCNGVEKQCGELKITKWRNQNENNHN